MYLEQQGVLTPYGNASWCRTSLAGVLKKRTYLGEVRSGEYVKEHAHEPLTDAATWMQAQRARDVGDRKSSSPSLLGGLLRCAACRTALASSSRDVSRGSVYACHRVSSAGRCPAPAQISASMIEPYIEREVFRVLAARRDRPEPVRTIERLQVKADVAERALTEYRDSSRLQRTLGPERFAAGLETRAAALERALLRVAAARARREPAWLPPTDQLREAWPSMTVIERRDVIARVIDCAFITKGKYHVPERTHICRRGEAPLDLPQKGGKRHALTPFVPPGPSG